MFLLRSLPFLLSLDPSLLFGKLDLLELLQLLFLSDLPLLFLFLFFDQPLLDVILLALIEHTREDLDFTIDII